jgi:hypothetical protein
MTTSVRLGSGFHPDSIPSNLYSVNTGLLSRILRLSTGRAAWGDRLLLPLKCGGRLRSDAGRLHDLDARVGRSTLLGRSLADGVLDRDEDLGDGVALAGFHILNRHEPNGNVIAVMEACGHADRDAKLLGGENGRIDLGDVRALHAAGLRLARDDALVVLPKTGIVLLDGGEKLLRLRVACRGKAGLLDGGLLLLGCEGHGTIFLVGGELRITERYRELDWLVSLQRRPRLVRGQR